MGEKRANISARRLNNISLENSGQHYVQLKRFISSSKVTTFLYKFASLNEFYISYALLFEEKNVTFNSHTCNSSIFFSVREFFCQHVRRSLCVKLLMNTKTRFKWTIWRRENTEMGEWGAFNKMRFFSTDSVLWFFPYLYAAVLVVSVTQWKSLVGSSASINQSIPTFSSF